MLPRVLQACDKYPDKKNAARLRALTLLVRYSGLRVTDAVTLAKHRIQDGVLTLRTAKTGTDVRVPLPPTALDALAATPAGNCYFWTGRGRKSPWLELSTGVQKLYKIAEVKNGYAHRWRETFAVELLLAGVPPEQVRSCSATPQ